MIAALTCSLLVAIFLQFAYLGLLLSLLFISSFGAI